MAPMTDCEVRVKFWDGPPGVSNDGRDFPHPVLPEEAEAGRMSWKTVVVAIRRRSIADMFPLLDYRSVNF